MVNGIERAGKIITLCSKGLNMIANLERNIELVISKEDWKRLINETDYTVPQFNLCNFHG
ncbi:hypothetical protein SAMN05443270_3564 [Lacrimispora sphenoides]|nr:hypothetical protein SAMN05443270_3564 [Lacrimispora sphenoides]